MPMAIPISPATMITINASYMKILLPSASVTPIERSTPYSQMLSLMLEVVATMSRKKVKIKEIKPISPTKNVNARFIVLRPFRIAILSTTRVSSDLKKGRRPFMMNYLRSDVQLLARLMYRVSLGTPLKKV